MQWVAEFLSQLMSSFLLQSSVVAIWFIVLFPFALRVQRRLPGLAAGLCWLILLRAIVPIDFLSAVQWQWNLGDTLWSSMPSLPPIFDSFANAEPHPLSTQWRDISTGLIVVIVWLTVSLSLLYQYESRRRRLVKVARNPTGSAPAWVATVFKQLKIQLNVRDAHLVVADSADFAYTLGSRRPVVVFPAGMLELESSSVKNILAHELMHVKRRDDVKLQFLNYIGIVCCYFPLVCWCARVIVQCAERQCDRAAISQLGVDRKSYASSLLAAAALQVQGSTVVMQLSPGKLLQDRLRSIYEPGALNFRSAWPVRCLMLIVIVAFFPVHAEFFDQHPDVQMVAPVSNARFTSAFGVRPDPFGRGQAHFHYGVDLAAQQGEPVLAVAAGRILKVGVDEKRGVYVVIGHAGELSSSYSHLHEASVEEGQVVVRGQRLGDVGQTGLATGPHVHFELMLAGQAVDPESYIAFEHSEG